MESGIFFVFCPGCGSTGPRKHTRSDARSAWNTRPILRTASGEATEPSAPLVERIIRAVATTHSRSPILSHDEARAALSASIPSTAPEPCVSVDCGGAENAHSSDCPYMIETFGEPTTAPEGWIVGNGSGDKWRAWSYGPVWVSDRDKATRYARREDAEAVHADDEDAWSIEPYSAALTTTAQGDVVQADRVRAASAVWGEVGNKASDDFREEILAGDRDGTLYVQAFRDHRLAFSHPSDDAICQAKAVCAAYKVLRTNPPLVTHDGTQFVRSIKVDGNTIEYKPCDYSKEGLLDLVRKQSSPELSSLAGRVLNLGATGTPEYNDLLLMAKRLAGSVLSQDET